MNLAKTLKTAYLKILGVLRNFVKEWFLFDGWVSAIGVSLFLIIICLALAAFINLTIVNPETRTRAERNADYILEQYQTFETRCLQLEYTKDECYLIWSGNDD